MSDNTLHHNVTRKMLTDGLRLETGCRHVLHLAGDKLHLRLEIDPADASTVSEKFILIGLRGDARVYEQTRTTKDDVEPGDRFLDLIYTGLIPDLDYSLEVDPGESTNTEKHFCFEDVPWKELKKALRS